MKKLKGLLIYALILCILGCSFPYVMAADDDSAVHSITTGNAYNLEVASGYKGSILVSFYAKGSGLTAKVKDEASAEIVSADLGEYINTSDFTKISLLVYKNTGKYMIYTGENDEYKTTQTFDAKFGVAVKSVEFSSESASIKNAQINEFLRSYKDSEKTALLDISYDNSDDGTDPTDIVPTVGKTSKGSYYNYKLISDDNDGKGTYYIKKAGDTTKYYYSYKTFTSPLYGKCLKMSSTDFSDQRIKFATGAVTDKNFEISAELLLPALENKGATTKQDMLTIFSTQDKGYQMPIVTFQALTATADEGATFAAFDADKNKLFSVPIDSANARDKWIKINIIADVDAQKYEITLEYDGKTVTSMKGIASDFVTQNYDHCITQTREPGFVLYRNTAYIKNFKVWSMERDDVSTMKLSEQTVRDTVSDALKTAVRDATESLNYYTNNIANGIALDTLGKNETAISWSSSDPSVISNTGVVHPKVGSECNVTLTATVSKETASLTKEFNVVVPAVAQYEINGIKVTGNEGDDGVVDSFLVKGKKVSGVNIKKYTESTEPITMICALFNEGRLEGVVQNSIDTSTVDRYNEKFFELNNPLILPDEMTDSYTMKVMLIDGFENIKPLSAVKSFGTQSQNPTVYICSDSTACPYDETLYYPRTGWGVALEKLLTSNAQMQNIALGGKSSRSFFVEGDFNKLDNLKSGDIVIVQFGHNDSAASNADRRTTVNLDSYGNIDYTKSNSYVQYLQLYVNKAREKEASIIFVTPPNRGDSYESAGFKDFSAAMIKFADAKGVPYVDLTSATKTLFTDVKSAGGNVLDYYMYWADQSAKDKFITKWGKIGTFYNSYVSNKDTSHFTCTGAEAVAQLFAGEAVDKKSVISRYIDKTKLKTENELVNEATGN